MNHTPTDCLTNVYVEMSRLQTENKGLREEVERLTSELASVRSSMSYYSEDHVPDDEHKRCHLCNWLIPLTANVCANCYGLPEDSQ